MINKGQLTENAQQLLNYSLASAQGYPGHTDEHRTHPKNSKPQTYVPVRMVPLFYTQIRLSYRGTFFEICDFIPRLRRPQTND